MDFITENLNTILTVLSVIVFPLLGFLIFKLFRGPRLEIDINFNGGSRRRGNVIDYPHYSDEVPYADDLTYNYDFRQDFEISIHNNSDVDAYDVKVEVSDLDNAEFHINGKTEFSPLSAHEKNDLSCRFSRTVPASYRNPPDVNELREQIKNEVEVKTSATNKYRFKNFYTKYSSDHNSFSFIHKE